MDETQLPRPPRMSKTKDAQERKRDLYQTSSQLAIMFLYNMQILGNRIEAGHPIEYCQNDGWFPTIMAGMARIIGSNLFLNETLEFLKRYNL